MGFDGKVEYAKSSRSSCRKCKSSIAQGTLRIAKLVQNPKFDGVMPQWYHQSCFWEWKGSSAASSVSEFEGFDSIKWDDQKAIEEKLNSTPSASAPSKGGKKRSGAKLEVEVLRGAPGLKAEYAKSSRSKCRMCGENIQAGEVRLAVERASEDQPWITVPKWFHRRCFIEAIQTEDYEDVPLAQIRPENFDGFASLEKGEIKDLAQLFDTARANAGLGKAVQPAKKQKVAVDEGAEKKLKAQTEKLWNVRKKLESVNSSMLKYYLDLNNQPSQGGLATLQERCADGIVFGALQKCPECKCNTWKVEKDGYHCQGFVDEFGACFNVTHTPPVKPFKLDSDILDTFPELKKIAAKPLARKFREEAKSQLGAINKASSAESQDSGTAASTSASASSGKRKAESGSKKPMQGRTVALAGRLKRTVAQCTKIIESLGARVEKGKVGSSTTVVVSTEAEVDKKSTKIKDADKFGTPIVSEAWLTECEKKSECALLTPHLISCSSVFLEPSQEEDRREQKRSRKAEAKADTKLVVKGRCAVEPDSEMQDTAHVLDEGHTVWNAQMILVNLRDGKNSYYKIQLLESDDGRGYYLFRAWGRIGATVGGTKLDRMNKAQAKAEFEKIFLDKTGNLWRDRENFEKKPRLHDFLLTAYEDATDDSTGVIPGSKSKLPAAVQQLIHLIFDETMLKQSMKEMDIDLNKLPLGRLSASSLKEAFEILGDIQTALESDTLSDSDRAKEIARLTSKYYSKIPHDFGNKRAPMIDNVDLLRQKVELVQTLMDIECTTRIIKSEKEDSKNNPEEDPIDVRYKKLKAKIKPVAKDSEDFEMVKKYVKNTHAATHRSYQLEVEEVFVVRREGEKKKYNAKSATLHNKRLLWHGSRLSNWGGILSEGLRIAPPTAPSTGYMFGKGVYFADMVSKSANYCHASSSNPTALLLLCEVALGDMYERKHADYIEKLPDGKHSTFGVGQTAPDPKGVYIHPEDGVMVPLGKGKASNVANSSLLYNEFIVYDTAQIRQRYLIRTRFKF
eukprot:m.100947 g.100947  ORF g.100947 m.100947 type:complete len:1020 (-) comp13730_c0_seq1:96-3155(-)